MADVKALLGQFEAMAADPKALMDRYIAEGKKVVGCFPPYTPEELVHAAGMVPMGLWGGQVTPSVAGKYNPIFTCSLMRSCMELGMTGAYEGLSAVIMPMLCDTYRGMAGAWRVGVPGVPLIAFIHPQNRTDPGARDYLAAEYRTVAERLEKMTGAQVTEEALQKSIDVYNDHAAAMLDFCRAANEHLDVVEQLDALPRHAWKGKKLVLTGITAEPDSLLEMFTAHGIAVVADDLAQESRQYRTPVPAGKDGFDRLAGQWQGRQGCSMVHETRAERGQMLVDMAKETGADGVAVCLMRFCDVEEYDFPYISRDVEAAGMPCLCLEIDQSTQNNQQNGTKIQSFVEM